MVHGHRCEDAQSAANNAAPEKVVLDGRLGMHLGS